MSNVMEDQPDLSVHNVVTAEETRRILAFMVNLRRLAERVIAASQSAMRVLGYLRDRGCRVKATEPAYEIGWLLGYTINLGCAA